MVEIGSIACGAEAHIAVRLESLRLEVTAECGEDFWTYFRSCPAIADALTAHADGTSFRDWYCGHQRVVVDRLQNAIETERRSAAHAARVKAEAARLEGARAERLAKQEAERERKRAVWAIKRARDKRLQMPSAAAVGRALREVELYERDMMPVTCSSEWVNGEIRTVRFHGLTDDEKMVCAQLGLSEEDYLAERNREAG